MTERERPRVIDFVPDIPLSDTWCNYNTMAHRGNHRQCEKYGQVEIEGRRFCKRHAAAVKKALEQAND